jgi:hypothetical protein
MIIKPIVLRIYSMFKKALTHQIFRDTCVCQKDYSCWNEFSRRANQEKDEWMVGNSMSIGGRLIKIDACLSSTAVYQMSMRLLHKTNIEQMDEPIRSFFWTRRADKRKYHFVKWKWICKPKKKGGLGVKELHKFNISLICKWWWKLENDSGPWQDFMNKKYLKGASVFYTKHKPCDSPLWSDMMHIESLYLCGRRMQEWIPD